MKSVISKENLLEVIKKNRENHKKTYVEAYDGYVKEAIRKFEKAIVKLKKGEVIDNFIGCNKPEDHTDEYDRLIEMIEMDTRTEITLDEIEFKRFVQDDWDWKGRWEGTVSQYVNISED